MRAYTGTFLFLAGAAGWAAVLSKWMRPYPQWTAPLWAVCGFFGILLLAGLVGWWFG